jgi:cysteine synthase A
MIKYLHCQKFQHLCNFIGNTPLSKLSFNYLGKKRTLYVKHEHYNLTGSVKDRMALHILHEAYQKGFINDQTTIVEATSGNTGISFSALGSALGHPVVIFMPDWLSKERVSLIKSFGAHICLVSKEEGGFLGSIQKAQDYAEKNPNVFLPSQFKNQNNADAHYRSTGPEIYHQLKHLGLTIDAFVAGVGTGGTIMGTGRFLKTVNPNIQLFPVEPLNSPTLSTGYKTGRHRIEGISDEFIPELVQLDFLDDIIAVDDGDAILMAQKLACKLGMGVGISSGANFIAALKVLDKLGDHAVVCTVFSDDNKKYLSTSLMNDEPIKSEYYSQHVTNLFVETVVTSKDIGFASEYYCTRK